MNEWLILACVCVCMRAHVCSYNPMHALDSAPHSGYSFFFFLLKRMHVCEPGCVCLLLAAPVGGGVAKTLKRERNLFFFLFFPICVRVR